MSPCRTSSRVSGLSQRLSWVLNIYILTFGGLLLLGGRAGDLLGRRRVFLTGIALFTSAHWSGPRRYRMDAARIPRPARHRRGTGGTICTVASHHRLAEGPARVRAIGLYTTVSAAGGALGLVAGGLLTDLVSWRWVMFVNVPIGLSSGCSDGW